MVRKAAPKPEMIHTLPRGSKAAADRALRRWAKGERNDATGFRCLGCNQWTSDLDGGSESGAAGLCCSACAVKMSMLAEDPTNAAD